MTTQCAQAPLGFHPLISFKMAMVCMLDILAKQKYHSPSMTLSWFPKQNDQVPQKFAKNTYHNFYHGHTMTHARPV